MRKSLLSFTVSVLPVRTQNSPEHSKILQTKFKNNSYNYDGMFCTVRHMALFLCHHANNSKKLFSRRNAVKAVTKPFKRHIV